MESGERLGPALIDLSELSIAETAFGGAREKNGGIVLRIELEQRKQRTNHLPRVQRTLVELQKTTGAVGGDATTCGDEVEEVADVGKSVLVIQLEKNYRVEFCVVELVKKRREGYSSLVRRVGIGYAEPFENQLSIFWRSVGEMTKKQEDCRRVHFLHSILKKS